MVNFRLLLQGGDLRSLKGANSVQKMIQSQKEFDQLIQGLLSDDRLMVMRCADVVEKISLQHPEYLSKHKKTILSLLSKAVNKELKWHLALLAARLTLTGKEFIEAWNRLHDWALDKNESRIVRVNSLQGLVELLQQQSEYSVEFEKIISVMKKEDIPSLNARIKKLKNKLLV